VFLNTERNFVNSSGRVTIGNNVSFGHRVMVLKGVTIGDNCFIGAGSIVTKDIPANSIAVGAPCKVVMTLEEFYQKRLNKSEAEALDYVRSIKERFNRRPRLDEMREEFIWFVSGDEVNKYPMLPIKQQLGPTYDNYIKSHKAKYASFDEFLAAAGINS
jgi:acyl-[acyl carrier protein]--UDP-N-acetylglucosamine O-acyltransferase